jgi:thiamine-monophosphate kinase
MMGEFDAIAALFAPLSRNAPGAFGLTDDAALLSAPGDLIVTADALVAGVHFLPDDPLESVGWKLVAVNVSDLTAKGAAPVGAVLTLCWPQGRPLDHAAAFAAGLGEALDRLAGGCPLIGGDTTGTPGPLTVSLTLFGAPLGPAMVRRAGAAPGDIIAVTGVIGDGGLGLAAARGDGAFADIDRAVLAEAWRRPQPPTALAGAIGAHAAAALDVSDGLIADLGHLARASGVAIRLELSDLPLSPAAARWLADQPDRTAGLVRLATAGDDYQTALAVTPERWPALAAAAGDAGVRLTRIGACSAGAGVEAIGADGAPVAPGVGGWRHF